MMRDEFLSKNFAPKAQNLIVYSPTGKHEFDYVVTEIIKYIDNPNFGTHPRYSLNDIGIGYLFADSYKWKLRYVPERKQWYEYNGKIWAPYGDGIKEYYKHFIQMLEFRIVFINNRVRNIYMMRGDTERRVRSFINKYKSQRSMKTILESASSVYPVSIAEFDRDPYIFNCKNCTVNLKTGKDTRHRPQDMLTKMANVNFVPKAVCPRWIKHMEEVLLEDKDLIIYLQKALGYALTGITRYECFFILFGQTSRNGKGVTMNTFLHMIGDYGCNVSPDTITQKKYFNGSAPSEDIARLVGARFVNISEPDENMVLSSALVKTLTGNDTITARNLFERSFEYKPTYKIFINTNHLPTVTDRTLFDSDRVRVIPFERHFKLEKQDTGLKDELTRPENLSGILNWCIEGLKPLVKGGFKPKDFEMPEAVKIATSKYAQDSIEKRVVGKNLRDDNIIQFIDDVLEACPGGEVRTMSAYGHYCVWCEEKGYEPHSQKSFSQKMKIHAKLDKKRPSGNSSANPVSMIIGYRFKNSV